MSIDDTIADLIHLPRNFNRGDVSVYSLLRDSGYFATHEQVTESEIHRVLVRHPECVNEWLSYSEDRRTGAGWFIQRSAKGFHVGYYPAGSSSHSPVDYSDETVACAAFIKHEAEDIRTDGRQRWVDTH